MSMAHGWWPVAPAKRQGRRGRRRAFTLPELYETLFAEYATQNWWPGESPFEVMVGAILTQNTAWTNVEKAISALRGADALNAESLRTLPIDELAALIRPSGYFNVKARKLRVLGEYLAEYDDDCEKLFASKPLDALRDELLALYGVGPETADSMLLYAGGLPSFVIDAYTIRVLGRLGIIDAAKPPSYEQVRALFQKAMPTSVQLFNEYHALFVIHGKDVCTARRPRCSDCVLVERCPTGQEAG